MGYWGKTRRAYALTSSLHSLHVDHAVDALLDHSHSLLGLNRRAALNRSRHCERSLRRGPFRCQAAQDSTSERSSESSDAPDALYPLRLGSTPGLEMACCRLLVHIQRTDQCTCSFLTSSYKVETVRKVYRTVQ